MISTKDCKIILGKLGKKFKVDPSLIATRLLSEDDKQDMRNGNLPIQALEIHIKLWMDSGMPDCAHGLDTPLKRNF